MPKNLNKGLKKIKMALETDLNLGVEEIYAPLPKSELISLPADKSASALKSRKAERLLKTLSAEVEKCKKCPLRQTRTHAVFGEGSPLAELMFVGEAPGRDEDLQGRPFVGRAGQLLTKIIQAMTLKREDVYIANILKDRPPENRNPSEDEIKACIPHLKRQIKIIQPKVICALGTFAAQILLNEQTPISKLRGRFFLYEGIKLMPTYHPAYLLRNPKEKAVVWQDMKLIMEELSLQVK